MANLKEIRVRIASVKSTQQITSAMKMVSAAKLKKAQDAILQLRPYAEKMKNILSEVYNYNDGYEDKLFFKERPVNNVLIVLITSNRGLCGAFNNNAIKLAISLATNDYYSQWQKNKVKFICIGKKGYDYLRTRNFQIIEHYTDITEKPSYETCSQITDTIVDKYLSGEFDKVLVVYNKFKNAAVQQLVSEQFLPIPVKKEKKISKVKEYNNDFIFEPNKAMLLSKLVPLYLKTMLHSSVVDSVASEHGARMTAMHKATDNAAELLRQLTLNYNKARQASITNEILEIVGGAEALKG